ncbi:MAG: molybdenum cofactor guanylyltransferase [Anaerolineaceae bacterium]
MKNKHLLSICILAGGDSHRMGHNKALMLFRGQPLIKRVVERVSPLAVEVFIVANDPGVYQFLELPIYMDKVKGAGVMGGLFTALSITSTPYVAVLACDLPYVNINLINAELNLMQAELVDVVIPESKNGLEPLHALYRCDTCLPQVQQALAVNQKRLVSWMDQVKVKVMPAEQTGLFDPLGIAFLNINTPQDLVRAEAIARKLDQKEIVPER